MRATPDILALPRAATSPGTGPAERDRVVESLRHHATAMRERGVRRLHLFGSMARGEAGPGSDIDLLAEIDHEGRKFSLLDLARLELDLASLLGRPVEMVTAWEQLRPRMQARLRRDMIEIF